MALRRNPTSFPATQVDERRIDALIEKGGSVASPAAGDKRSLVQLRLTQSVIGRIDAVRKRRTVAPPRHAWMLEAILEKLAREEESR
jgi:hypothetical protein